ncbi:MAG: mannose-6-phosphate isomerase, partial [Clostridiales bacterium]|nr:mannose-6-phosphate isomerase [Clostridiales bacterium]
MLYKLKENRVYRTYIGGRHIDEFFGKRNPENGFYPEDWTASTVKAFNPGREDIDEGEGKTGEGISVKELVNGEMTCLVKLLDSDERLVIQVHP